jgi:hypothetical protein
MKKSKAKPISLLELTVRLVSEGAAVQALFEAFQESTNQGHKDAYEEAFQNLGPQVVELIRSIRAYDFSTNTDELELRVTTLRWQQAFEKSELMKKAKTSA